MIATVLDGLIQLAADDCEVVYSRGANVIDLVPDPAGEFYPDGQPRPRSASPPPWTRPDRRGRGQRPASPI